MVNQLEEHGELQLHKQAVEGVIGDYHFRTTGKIFLICCVDGQET